MQPQWNGHSCYLGNISYVLFLVNLALNSTFFLLALMSFGFKTAFIKELMHSTLIIKVPLEVIYFDHNK